MNEKHEWSSRDHMVIFKSDMYDLQIKVNDLLITSLWRIANIAAPIGCGSTTNTSMRAGGEKTEAHFWAVLERV